MNKRVLCLFLCLAMLLPIALTGCGNKTSEQAEEDISKSASESAITLTMWLVAEQVPSAATQNAINRAVNAITNAKFKIQLVLQYFTQEEYLAKLTDSISRYEKTRATGLIDVIEEEDEEETTAAPDETEINEYGLSVIKYPELIANQVDIIYLGDLMDSDGKVIYGEALYQQFIEKGWLAELDKELSASSKKIKEYVSPNLLSAAKRNGVTYAVPNNNVIGEYTYMLLDKKVTDHYKYEGRLFQRASGEVVDSFYDQTVYNLLDEVADDTAAERLNIDGVTYVPIMNEIDGSETDAYNKCLELLASYWSMSTESFELLKEFSVFGCVYTDPASLSRGSVELKYESLFNNPDFVADYLKLNEMRLKGYFKTAGEGERAAVRFVSGDSTILDKDHYNAGLVGQKMTAYEDKDYYAIPIQYPTASSDDIFGSMFGVYTYSRSVARSMEIITYLNTNADFRNLIQYGIEGTNYQVVQKNNVDVAEYLEENDYFMDIYKTGNAFLAYPQSTMSPDIWTRGKEQNRSSLVDPLLGFSVAGFAKEQAAKNSESSSFSGTYQISSYSGYSKLLLSENETLGAWLKKCDAAGKGLYVLKTSATDDSYTTYRIYLYNNGLTKNAKVNIIDSSMLDGTEQITKDVVIAVGYTDAAGTSATPGYDLSVVDAVAKKSLRVGLSATMNGTELPASITEDYLVKFDLDHTKTYDLEVSNLRIPSVDENTVLKQWINECTIRTDKPNRPANTKEYTEKNFFTYASRDLGNGKTEYSYVLYRPYLTNETSLAVRTTGDRNGVTVHFDFNENKEAPYTLADLKKSEDVYSYSNYLLYYAVVTVDTGVNVDYVLSNASKNDTVTFNPDGFDFDVCGTLDTEIVKFVQNVNDRLLEILYACDDYETFADIVSDIAILTSGKKINVLDLKNDDVKSYADSLGETGLTILTEYVKVMLSAKRAHKQEPNDNDVLVDSLYVNGEDYVYYDSPYALYVQWLKAYGFNVK